MSARQASQASGAGPGLGGLLEGRSLRLLAAALVVFNGFFPALWILLTSLKSEAELVSKPITWWPANGTLHNYVQAFTDQPLLAYMANSLIVALLATLCSLAVSTCAAYAIARLNLRHRQLILTAIVASSMFPLVTLLVPIFETMRSLGLLNTYAALVVPYTVLNLPPLPLTMGIGQAAGFQISLTTLAVGTHAGSVMIASDDLDETLFDFPLTGEVFIPDPVSNVVSTTTTLNRQTGLREQTMHLTNDTTATVPAYNLIIRGLPDGVEVNNASGRREDGSWVVYVGQAMTPHSTQDILLEYFSANRGPVEIAPRLSTEVVLNPPDLSAPGEAGFIIDRVLRLEGGAVLIEFPTTPGRQYQVQYSHDGTNWQTSLPSIRAAANSTQWIDRGLPRTEKHPAQDTSRFYRVREVP